MLRNYFITALRFLIKNRLYTAINTVGLAASISCTMVIYLYIKDELTFDEFHHDIDRLYVLGEGSREGSEDQAAYYQTVYPALPEMLARFPEIETGTRWFDWEGHILIAGEKKFMHIIHYVDSTFLQTLTFPLAAGNPETALKRKDGVVISQDLAMKLFNTADVIGETIELDDGKQYTITGVLLPIPHNSSLRPEVLMPLAGKEDDKEFLESANWYNTIIQVAIKLRPGADPHQLTEKFPAFVKQHYDPAAKGRILKIYPLADLRQSVANNETYIYGLSSIGIFILLIAVINFMNLSIAGSLKRLRETGMRKLMGSTKKSIVLQFFLEASLLTLVAVTVSVGIVQVSLPLFNALLGMKLSLSGQQLADMAALGAILVMIIGLVAGGYPAMYLSRYKTVNAVKGIIPNYQGRLTLRNSLVVLQFIVSITLIVSVIVTSRQIDFMKTADLRFNSENVLVVDMDAGYKDEEAARARLAGIVDDLKRRADVMSVSLSQNVPGRYWENYNTFVPHGRVEGTSLRKTYVDDTYLDTYEIELVQGRNFSREHSDSLNTAMLNLSAMKAFGWESIEGKTLKEKGGNMVYNVVGVFDDFHYRSLEGEVQPLIHFFYAQSNNFLSVRIAPGKAKDVVTFMEEQWKAMDSWLGFTYFFVDEEFDTQYKSIERTLLLITLFTGVAIVISCAGIFALSAIAAQQRTKEIGIRKVLGASIASIVGLLSRDFIRLVMISVVLAAPLAWYGMSQWLNDFAYKIPLDWWTFVLAGTVAISIAFLTTGLQSIRAAMNNPAESLHND